MSYLTTSLDILIVVLARVSVHWTGKPWHLRRFLSSSTLSFRLSIFLLFINSHPWFRHRIFFIRRLACKTLPQFCHWSGKKDDIRQPNGIKDYTRRRWQATANQLQVWHKIYPLIYKERGGKKQKKKTLELISDGKDTIKIEHLCKKMHCQRESLMAASIQWHSTCVYFWWCSVKEPRLVSAAKSHFYEH